jgi:hypothetical protein
VTSLCGGHEPTAHTPLSSCHPGDKQADSTAGSNGTAWVDDSEVGKDMLDDNSMEAAAAEEQHAHAGGEALVVEAVAAAAALVPLPGTLARFVSWSFPPWSPLVLVVGLSSPAVWLARQGLSFAQSPRHFSWPERAA